MSPSIYLLQLHPSGRAVLITDVANTLRDSLKGLDAVSLSFTTTLNPYVLWFPPYLSLHAVAELFEHTFTLGS